MNREFVGEPSVSAFLRSVTRNLGRTLSSMKATMTALILYDPRQDLKRLNEKLASFQDLLVDGEARRLDETAVDGWMDDLKDLLYDVEDILDDIKSPSNDQVRFDELKRTWDEIKKLLIKILDKIDVLVARAKDLELKRGSRYAFSGKFNAIRRTRETGSTVDMSEIHGRDEDKRAIVERLMASEEKGRKNYAVLSVVGMGGLGKTTLAQLVFNDPDVEKYFDLMSWVCISDVFDVVKATRELIQYWDGSGSSLDQQSLASLQRRLKEMVGNKKILFVLDDVWSSSEWEKMKAPFSSCANGSKILVTTRNIKIAQDLGDRNPYKLQGLNHEQCMAIFRDKAFGDGVIVEEWEQETLMILGQKIVEGCKGVPLAVKVIGSVLQGAEEEKWLAVSENADLWDATHMKDEIHPAIRLSYHYLPASLKRCFEFLAAFPTDSEFERDYVVRLWIAEGLVEEVDGRMVEDIGNEYYNELKARSLIQENDMMHDIVHHLARLVSTKFCNNQNSKEPYASVRHSFVVNPNGQFLAEAPSLRTLRVSSTRDPILQNDILPAIESCKMLRTLEIRMNFSFNPDLDSSISSHGETFMGNLTHLRYLTILNSRAQHLPDFICKMEILQFLDLHLCRDLQTLPQEMNHLSKLHYLRFHQSSLSILPETICALLQLQVLDLGECYQLRQLPKDIGNIRSLRTLVLKNARIKSLPESICALPQLRVLDLGECYQLRQLPKDIGNIKSLLTLVLKHAPINSLPESICALSKLQHLDLGECNRLRQFPKDIGKIRSLLTLVCAPIESLPESICALSQLQVLDLGERHQFRQLPKDIGNIRSLRTLVLNKALIESLPESICALSQLQVLDLTECYQLKQLPKDIGNIRSLLTLVLKRAPIKCLPESICALSQLQVLDLGKCARLEQLPKDMSNIRSLRTLLLTKTPITSLPESICALSQLQVLDLSGCGSLKQLPKDMIGNLRRLHTLHLAYTELEQSPLHIGRLSRLEVLPVYHVGKEEGLRLSELNLMNRLRGSLTIAQMENIESVEDASMADIKSKTNVRKLQFLWSRPDNDEEMAVKILEVLKPHYTLESMTIKNYGSDKFPDWIMSSNICLPNLTHLTLEGLNIICEMVGMEFVSLESLHIENCPRLRKVLMATPKLQCLNLVNLGGLEAASVHLVGSQLSTMECGYDIFEHFFEKLQTTGSKWGELEFLKLNVGGARVASLPRGWPTVMSSIRSLRLVDIGPGKFQFLPDGDESAFPPSLSKLIINKQAIEDKLPHHSYTINSNGKIEI